MTNLIEERQLTQDGKTFQVRLFGEAESYSIIAYLENKQISPCYSVSLEDHIDYFRQHKKSIIENIFEIAMSDIKRGIYFHA